MRQHSQFFKETTEASKIKSQIVSKYFDAWANVIVGANASLLKIGYLDLFAGPGQYADGTKSTPLLILEKAIGNPKIRDRLLAIFNDANPKHAQTLREAISALQGIDTLRYPPEVSEQNVDEQIAQAMKQLNLVPSLIFIDPWGYKGVTLDLIRAVIKDWGCDCIFFFNYSRINAGIHNPYLEDHVTGLFGADRIAKLRTDAKGRQPHEREILIMAAMTESLTEVIGKYALAYRFRNSTGSRTSHHIIFVSKNELAHDIMKGIMAQHSSSHPQEVASFEHDPSLGTAPMLIHSEQPLDDLEAALPKLFSGRTVRMVDVYREHNVGTRYIQKNYKHALLRLERKNRIVCTPPAERRKKDTFADNVEVFFKPED